MVRCNGKRQVCNWQPNKKSNNVEKYFKIERREEKERQENENNQLKWYTYSNIMYLLTHIPEWEWKRKKKPGKYDYRVLLKSTEIF